VIGPAFSQTHKQCLVFNAGLSRQLSNGSLRTISQINKFIISNIIHLLYAGCPSAIGRFVIAIHLFAIQTMPFRWRTAHINKKILITGKPPFTNNNSASPVYRIFRFCFSITTSFHPKPSSIFLSWLISFTMRLLGLARNSSPVTTTTFCLTRAQCAGEYQRGATAIAKTIPSDENTAMRSLRLNCEKTVTTTSQVLFLHSYIIYQP